MTTSTFPGATSGPAEALAPPLRPPRRPDATTPSANAVCIRMSHVTRLSPCATGVLSVRIVAPRAPRMVIVALPTERRARST